MVDWAESAALLPADASADMGLRNHFLSGTQNFYSKAMELKEIMNNTKKQIAVP